VRNLRHFQQCTIDHVVDRFWGSHSLNRFLVADEVGLGKTLVARGVIAHGLKRASLRGVPFRVIYLCANTLLAKQNHSKLREGMGDLLFAEGDRLTSLAFNLPTTPNALMALTPGTSLNLRRTLGTASERIGLLSLALAAGWDDCISKAICNVFQGTTKTAESFRYQVDHYIADYKPHSNIIAAIRRDSGLRERFRRLCEIYHRSDAIISDEQNQRRKSFIADFRRRVARSVLSEIKPDIVILDEFQRFRHVLSAEAAGDLDGDTSSADEIIPLNADERLRQEQRAALDLASQLLHSEAKVLMLSATPFKAFTRIGEEEDHFESFRDLVQFIMPSAAGEIIALLKERRTGLQSGAVNPAIRRRLETILISGISRIERMGTPGAQESTLLNTNQVPLEFTLDHARDAMEWVRLARAVGYRDPISLWSSVPYGMHFLDRYEFSKLLDQSVRTQTGCDKLNEVLNRIEVTALPSPKQLDQYRILPNGHPGLNWLIRDSVDKQWNLPWVPPSCPYWDLSGPFAANRSMSKRLVFSAWRSSPRSLAGLLSYAAEFRAVEQAKVDKGMSPNPIEHVDAVEEVDQGWQRAKSDDVVIMYRRRAGQPVWSTIALAYPSRWLAEHGAECALPQPGPCSYTVFVNRMVETIRSAVIGLATTSSGPSDHRWYGVAPILLDRLPGGSPVLSVLDPLHAGNADLLDLANIIRDIPNNLGRQPDDLVSVLADIALCSPGVCMRRALTRSTGIAWSDASLDGPAALAAWAFIRYLDHRPHSVAIRFESADNTRRPFWKGILARGQEGCLQSILDEHCHLLRDDCVDGSSVDVMKMTDFLVESLSLQRASVSAKRSPVDKGRLLARGEVAEGPHFKFRTHFAVQFGSSESVDEAEGNQSERLKKVQAAFNSPWWPFVLISTSIGQEGLDFHRWCRSVVHWNLPWNPVDLEQREGRVNRYRGLAVRRNLVAGLSPNSITCLPGGDPWTVIFKCYPPSADGLVPDWVCPGQHAVERIVPLLPLSRRCGQLKDLCTLSAVYRSLLGQPGQEDLIERLNDDHIRQLALDAFDLRPDTLRSVTL